jgi:hypothetical protein
VELLESLEGNIATRGFDRERDRKIISMVFGEESELRLTYELCRDPKQGTDGPLIQGFDLPPAARQAEFLKCLRSETKGLKREQKTLKELSEKREGLEHQSSNVPELGRTDRLLRYSTSIQRDFDRCLNQLERLQRIRKGQPAPPTLNVNVLA